MPGMNETSVLICYICTCMSLLVLFQPKVLQGQNGSTIYAVEPGYKGKCRCGELEVRVACVCASARLCIMCFKLGVQLSMCKRTKAVAHCS